MKKLALLLFIVSFVSCKKKEVVPSFDVQMKAYAMETPYIVLYSDDKSDNFTDTVYTQNYSKTIQVHKVDYDLNFIVRNIVKHPKDSLYASMQINEVKKESATACNNYFCELTVEITTPLE